MRSTSSRSPPVSSTRSGAASSRTPRAPRAQGRPAVPDPRPAAPRPGTFVRRADRQPQHLPAAGRPGHRGDRSLARLPAAAQHVPGQGPSRGQGHRRAGHRLVPGLPHPRSCSPGPHPQAVEDPRARQVRHPPHQQRAAPKPSTWSSRRPSGWPTASEPSTTTDYGSWWQPQEPSPTDEPPPPMRRSEEPSIGQAPLPSDPVDAATSIACHANTGTRPHSIGN